MAVGSDDGSSSTTRSERISGSVLRQPSIPQSSRLLQPTLSWQAKASFIPETFSTLTAKQLEDITEQADSDTVSEASTAAMSTKSLAAFTARRTSTSWKQRASRSSDGGQRKKKAARPLTSPQSSDTLAEEVRQDLVEPVTTTEQHRTTLRHGQPTSLSSPIFTATPSLGSSAAVATTFAAVAPEGYASRAASGRLRSAAAVKVAQASMSPQSSGALADTLLQQRARLKPVQTSASTKALLASTAAAGVSGGEKVGQASDKGQNSGRTGGASAARGAARVSGDKTGVGAVQQAMRPPHSGASREGMMQRGMMQRGSETSSGLHAAMSSGNNTAGMATPEAASASGGSGQAPSSGQGLVSTVSSNLRHKYGSFVNLLEVTALQRGLSLSEVAVPAKPSKGQSRARRSLEEVRASFRSVTQVRLDTSPKSSPARRVSTGALTTAFLEEKNRRDKALLASLGFSEDADDLPGDSASRRTSISNIQGHAADFPRVSQYSNEQQSSLKVSTSADTAQLVSTGSSETIGQPASSGTSQPALSPSSHSAALSISDDSHIASTSSAAAVSVSVHPSAAQSSHNTSNAAASTSEQPSSSHIAQLEQTLPQDTFTSVGQDVPQSTGILHSVGQDVPQSTGVLDSVGQDVPQSTGILHSVGEGVPKSVGHRRRPSTDVSSLPSMMERRSTGNATEASGTSSLPAILEGAGGIDESSEQGADALRSQTSEASGMVMASMPSFNTSIRMKWGVPKPDPKPQRTFSRMAKQSSLAPGGVVAADDADTIKAIGSASALPQTQSNAAAVKGPILTEEVSLKIRGDAIEGPKFVKSKAGKGKWWKRLFCGCATKE